MGDATPSVDGAAPRSSRLEPAGDPRANVLGPGTIAWERPADWRFSFLAGRSLLLQVMHPVVAAGVDQHSDYLSDPWGRLVGTLDLYVCRVLYGGPETAPRAARLLRAIHGRIKGVDAHGREYSALDPEPFMWVHSTLVEGGMQIWEQFGDPMSADERERYYREMMAVGRLYGIDADAAPADWGSFRDYFDAMVETRLEATEVALNVLGTIDSAPMPEGLRIPGALWRGAMRYPGRIVRLSTIGTLPERARRILGVELSGGERRELDAYRALARTTFRRMPARLRLLPPVYDAVHRGRYPVARSRAEERAAA